MHPVLDLHPVLRPASLIGPVPALRHQPFKTHVAGGTKQIGADLALFERCNEDAIRSACQQTGKVGLAIDSGSLRRSRSP